MTTFEPTTLKEVRLEGELKEFPDVVQAAKAHAGSKVTYWDLLDDADRIRQRLVNQGYLEAVVDARLDDDVAVFTGVAGRRHRWRVEGMDNPPNIDPIMKGALFEEEGTDKARQWSATLEVEVTGATTTLDLDVTGKAAPVEGG